MHLEDVLSVLRVMSGCCRDWRNWILSSEGDDDLLSVMEQTHEKTTASLHLGLVAAPRIVINVNPTNDRVVELMTNGENGGSFLEKLVRKRSVQWLQLRRPYESKRDDLALFTHRLATWLEVVHQLQVLHLVITCTSSTVVPGTQWFKSLFSTALSGVASTLQHLIIEYKISAAHNSAATAAVQARSSRNSASAGSSTSSTSASIAYCEPMMEMFLVKPTADDDGDDDNPQEKKKTKGRKKKKKELQSPVHNLQSLSIRSHSLCGDRLSPAVMSFSCSSLMAIFQSQPHLQILELDSVNLRTILQCAAEMSRLTKLILNELVIDDDQGKNLLDDCITMDQLQHLEIGKLTSLAGLQGILQRCPNLHSLLIDNVVHVSSLIPTVIIDMVHLQRLRLYRTLYAQDISLVAPVLQLNLPRITTLQVDGFADVALPDEHMAHLVTVEIGCSCTAEMSIVQTQLDRLRNNAPRLRRLTISNVFHRTSSIIVGGNSLKVIKLINCPHLLTMDIVKTSRTVELISLNTCLQLQILRLNKKWTCYALELHNCPSMQTIEPAADSLLSRLLRLEITGDMFYDRSSPLPIRLAFWNVILAHDNRSTSLRELCLNCITPETSSSLQMKSHARALQQKRVAVQPVGSAAPLRELDIFQLSQWITGSKTLKRLTLLGLILPVHMVSTRLIITSSVLRELRLRLLRPNERGPMVIDINCNRIRIVEVEQTDGVTVNLNSDRIEDVNISNRRHMDNIQLSKQQRDTLRVMSISKIRQAVNGLKCFRQWNLERLDTLDVSLGISDNTLDDNSLHSIFRHAHNLRHIRLSIIHGPRRLSVTPCKRLKTFELQKCVTLVTVEFDSVDLYSICIHHCKIFAGIKTVSSDVKMEHGGTDGDISNCRVLNLSYTSVTDHALQRILRIARRICVLDVTGSKVSANTKRLLAQVNKKRNQSTSLIEYETLFKPS